MGKRQYNSPRRQEQAEATRQKILDAAHRLFVQHGYAATTLPVIASEAGVAAPTITAVFGTKLAILESLIRSYVRGDEEAGPLTSRPWWQKMLLESDPEHQLELYAENIFRIHHRTTDIFEIVRGAATVDPEIAELRRNLGTNRYQDVLGLAESLGSKQALQPEMTVKQAMELLWVQGSAEIYRMLVVDHSWSEEKYREWLSSTLIYALLKRDKRD